MILHNMVTIIPSINAPTFEEIQARIKKVEPYAEWCHLDVTDGIFSKHLTWHDPQDLPRLATPLAVEVHLMVMEPEQIINNWLISPIKRVIVHLEASHDLEFVINACRKADIEIGIAIRPDTFWGALEPWISKIDLVQVLAVNPGPSGQMMSPDSVEKVRHLRIACSHCMIEVDGGINAQTISDVSDAGADIVVAGSSIFSAENIKEAIEELRK